jgi:hypothetical protein
MEWRTAMSNVFRLTLISLSAAGAFVVGTSPGWSGEESQAESKPDALLTSPLPADERFEGYEFLGADGRALPIQSDAAIEDYLRTASVVSVSKIPVGITRPRKFLLEKQDLRAYASFKTVDEEKKNVRDPTTTGRGKLYLTWRDSYLYDVAAYHVDRLLGLDRAPPTVVRKLKGSEGSLQIWIEGTITEAERLERAISPPEIARFNQQRTTLQLFDNLVGNRDSNLGNTLIDGNWRLWFIDCSRCFERSPDLLYPEMITHCDRRMWEALKKLDRSLADQVLSPFLTAVEIDALFARRDKLVELLQSRIDEWGEELVLFNQRPPTDKAPWVEE